jgi:hypothetical protein
MLIRDWRRAVRPLLTVVAAIAAGLLLCRASFGSAFFADMLATRAYGLSALLGQVGHLQWMAPAFALWAWWAIDDRATDPARFTALHVGISLAACLLQWTGDGVFGNAEFDLLLALGIGIGVAYQKLGKTRLALFIRTQSLRDMMVVILLLRLIAADRQESALVLLSPHFRSYFTEGQRAVRRDAAAVASIPGDVFCTVPLVCRVAGKPLAVDDFKFGELIKTGRFTSAEMDTELQRRSITRYMNDPMTVVSPDTSFSRWLRRGS